MTSGTCRGRLQHLPGRRRLIPELPASRMPPSSAMMSLDVVDETGDPHCPAAFSSSPCSVLPPVRRFVRPPSTPAFYRSANLELPNISGLDVWRPRTFSRFEEDETGRC